VFGLRLRQTEDFLASTLQLMSLDLATPITRSLIHAPTPLYAILPA